MMEVMKTAMKEAVKTVVKKVMKTAMMKVMMKVMKEVMKKVMGMGKVVKEGGTITLKKLQGSIQLYHLQGEF